MEIAKIRLSPEEAALVESADWILTKNRVMEKVKLLLEELREVQTIYLGSRAFSVGNDFINIPAKISRGENYRGLPYIVLDQPRYFKGEDVLAIRTMFWWGNFFSVTLHIGGAMKSRVERSLLESFEYLQTSELFICVNDGPWEYHFDQDNYVSFASLNKETFEDIILDRPFVKIAGKTNINDWPQAGDRSMEFFKQLLGLLE